MTGRGAHDDGPGVASTDEDAATTDDGVPEESGGVLNLDPETQRTLERYALKAAPGVAGGLLAGIALGIMSNPVLAMSVGIFVTFVLAAWLQPFFLLHSGIYSLVTGVVASFLSAIGLETGVAGWPLQVLFLIGIGAVLAATVFESLYFLINGVKRSLKKKHKTNGGAMTILFFGFLVVYVGYKLLHIKAKLIAIGKTAIVLPLSFVAGVFGTNVPYIGDLALSLFIVAVPFGFYTGDQIRRLFGAGKKAAELGEEVDKKGKELHRNHGGESCQYCGTPIADGSGICPTCGGQPVPAGAGNARQMPPGPAGNAAGAGAAGAAGAAAAGGATGPARAAGPGGPGGQAPGRPPDRPPEGPNRPEPTNTDGQERPCPDCGTLHPPGTAFCRECGTSIEEGAATGTSSATDPDCPDCGAPLPEGATFCRECGTSIEDGAATGSSPATAPDPSTGSDGSHGGGTPTGDAVGTDPASPRTARSPADTGSSPSTPGASDPGGTDPTPSGWADSSSGPSASSADSPEWTDAPESDAGPAASVSALLDATDPAARTAIVDRLADDTMSDGDRDELLEVHDGPGIDADRLAAAHALAVCEEPHRSDAVDTLTQGLEAERVHCEQSVAALAQLADRDPDAVVPTIPTLVRTMERHTGLVDDVAGLVEALGERRSMAVERELRETPMPTQPDARVAVAQLLDTVR